MFQLLLLCRYNETCCTLLSESVSCWPILEVDFGNVDLIQCKKVVFKFANSTLFKVTNSLLKLVFIPFLTSLYWNKLCGFSDKTEIQLYVNGLGFTLHRVWYIWATISDIQTIWIIISRSKLLYLISTSFGSSSKGWNSWYQTSTMSFIYRRIIISWSKITFLRKLSQEHKDIILLFYPGRIRWLDWYRPASCWFII